MINNTVFDPKVNTLEADADVGTTNQTAEAPGNGGNCAPLEPVPVSSFGLSSEAIGQVPTGVETSDLFAPENLRISQDFVEQASVETVHATIAVRPPSKQEFFMVRPGEEWQLSVAVIEDGEDRELWLIVPKLAASVSEEVSYVQLRLAVNRHGVPFLMPLKISRDGKVNSWNQSAMAAADTATTRWVRRKSVKPAGQYITQVAKGDFGEPEYPDMTFHQILELAFKGRIITTYDHPFLKQLRGEI